MRAACALLAPFAVLTLAACGGDREPAAGIEAGATVTSSSEAPAPDAGSTSGSTSGAEGRPATDTCTALPEAPDGRYAVADSGTVVLTREGDRLVLGEVSPAEGWETESVEEEDREVEVEFRRDGVEIDFEAEIEDGGRLDIEICTDDD